MTSAAHPPVHPYRRSNRPGPKRRLLVGALAAVGMLLLAGCTAGPGSKEDYIDVLQRDETFSETQATCIADRVFEKYGDDKAAIDLLSGAKSWEQLTGPEGIDGFEAFHTTVVTECTSVGPTLTDSE